MIIPPLRIVLSGGGIRSIAHSGALKKLEEAGLLVAVKEYIGVSAGALIAFFIAIGYSISQSVAFSKRLDWGSIRTLEPEDMLSFFENYGLDTGANLQRLLESLLRHKGFSSTLTYKQLREQLPGAPSLRVFAADLCTIEPREFSEKKTPDVMLITSLMASMCVPGYFVPIKDPETGHLLIDGGAFDDFPLSFLTMDEQELSLGITFSKDHLKLKSIGTIYEYFQQIYACFSLPRTLNILNKNKDKIIIVPCGEYPMMDFEASVENKERLIQLGYEAVTAFLNGTNKPTIKRRYSVS